MEIYEYKTVLAGDGRNVLVREREQSYEGVERIVSPHDTARIMRDVFRLHERAEEYVWLVCLDNGEIRRDFSRSPTGPAVMPRYSPGRFWSVPCCAGHAASFWYTTTRAGIPRRRRRTGS